MEIRSIHADDLPALLALYSHLHEQDEPLPESPVIEAVWQELLQSTRNKCFGGYVDSELVSSCTIAVIPNLTRGCRPYGVIENVVTHAYHRRMGYGQALLAHTLDFAWSSGCYKVMLMTGRKDNATLQFYESAGFDRHAKQAFVAKPGT
jgi:GNAT superfamily N-acetyltransferase